MNKHLEFSKFNMTSLGFGLLALTLGLSLSLSACGPAFTPNSDLSISPLAIGDLSELNEDQRADRAEVLVAEGEKLFNSYSISEAFGKFNEARALYPTHAKARFWIAFMKPLMEFEGIHRRVKPVFANLKDGERRYRKMIASSQRSQSPEIRRFLQQGPEDIRSSENVQEWMDRVITAVSESRVLLRELIDEEHDIVIGIKPGIISPGSSIAMGCGVQFYGPIRYEPADGLCTPGAIQKVGLANPDFRIVLLFYNYMQFTFEMFASYTMDSVAIIDGMSQDQEPNKSDPKGFDEFLKRLMSRPGDGKLRRAKPFSAITDFSSDMMAALQYAYDRQSELCPTGDFFGKSRSGYLAGFEICIPMNDEDDQHGKMVRTLEALLSGAAVELYPDDKGSPVSILPQKLVNEPIQDLKVAMNFEFDACGNVLKVKSNAFAPYFAEGSFQDVLSRGGRPHCRTEAEQ